MKRISISMMMLICWLGSVATAGAAVEFEQVVVSPWKEAAVYLKPMVKANQISISHVSQRTKIHSVEINNGEVVYLFETDPNLIDHRGQIKADLPPVLINLKNGTLVETMKIVAEGWNRPEEGNLFKVELERVRSAKLKHIASWVGYTEEVLKFEEQTVKRVDLTTSGKTKFHTLELVKEDGSVYDLIENTKLGEESYIDGEMVLHLPVKVLASKLVIKAESYDSSSEDKSTAIGLVLRKGAPDKPNFCKVGSKVYADGETFDQWLREKQSPQYCEHGGNKTYVYNVYQPKICKLGKIVNNGSIDEKYSKTLGRCNSAPVVTTCTTRRGVTKNPGDVWVVTPSGKTITEPVSCPNGGSVTKVYQAEVTRLCRQDGSIESIGESKGFLLDTIGVCRSRKTCTTRDGLTKRPGDTWVVTPPRRTVEEVVSCPSGSTGSLTKVYQARVTRLCKRDGSIDSTGDPAKGRLIRTIGECKRKPQPKTCTTRNGQIKQPGETWSNVIRGKEKKESRQCKRGDGSVTDVYRVVANMKCKRNGSIVKQSESKGDLIRTEGKCRPTPKPKTCTLANGAVKPVGATWTFVHRTKEIKEAVQCKRGEGSQTKVYKAIVSMKCQRGGKIVRQGESKGDHIRTEGKCRKKEPKKSCGDRPHGATWKVDTGRTETGTKQCGHEGDNTRVVTYKVFQGKQCANGDTKNTGKILEVLDRGVCGGGGGDNDGRGR